MATLDGCLSTPTPKRLEPFALKVHNMKNSPYGAVTPSMAGLAMKEMVRRAIQVIRAQRFVFETQHKDHLDTARADLVTTADFEAQRIYLRVLKRCFPKFGVVAEEDELRIPCTMTDRALWFTLDPLDGTKAFARRQSSGVGTMVALVDDGEVVAGYVGDVMTQEIYGFRPGASVYRISEYNQPEILRKKERPLDKAYLLLREQPKTSPPAIAQLYARFKGIDVEGGSIGISFARLWKGEVEALLMGPHFSTPWDSAPIIGISRRLGYRFLRIEADGRIQEFDFRSRLETVRVNHHVMVAGDQICNSLLESS